MVSKWNTESVEPEILSKTGLTLAPAGVQGWNLLGQSPSFKRVLHLVQKVAPTDSPVLITGETGTGKELVARVIHRASRRSQGPFVAVNAGAIPETLQESELFGHRKGAFTGADADRRGLFEEAQGGTLFLDEIGDTSLTLQVKLLRVLQTGSVRRVGEGVERPVDVRIIAATNRPLEEMVARGDFREDLFFRLNVVHLQLPALRDRGEDLEALLKSNLARFAQHLGKEVRGFTPEAWEALRRYFYPGNIRELENILHHAVIMADTPEIGLGDLPPYLTARLALPPALESIPVSAESAPAWEVPREAWLRPEPKEAGTTVSAPKLDSGDAYVTLAEMERRLIQATLERLKGNQSIAARKLGISRSTLWRKMKEYGIEA
jgi:two-component system nitrogen regulation response regulator GlnG